MPSLGSYPPYAEALKLTYIAKQIKVSGGGGGAG